MSRNTLTFGTLALALAGIVVSAQAQAPAVDPAAVKALDTMSAHLRGLKSFQVESSTTTDEVL